MGVVKSITCDSCGREIEDGKIGGKLYLSPPFPGMGRTSTMTSYTFSGDLCDECTEEFKGKLQPRKTRLNLNGKNSAHTKKRKKKVI